MKTKTKFLISLVFLIISVVVTVTKPEFKYLSEGALKNITLFVLIVSAFLTGLFFERRGKAEEKPALSVSPQYAPQLPQPQPISQFQQPPQQPPPTYYPPAQPRPRPPEKWTKPIDNIPKELPEEKEPKEPGFPSLEDLKK